MYTSLKGKSMAVTMVQPKPVLQIFPDFTGLDLENIFLRLSSVYSNYTLIIRAELFEAGLR